MVWKAEKSPHTKCRDCDSDVTWMKTHAGKNILVDRESIPDTWNEGDVYDRLKMTCHFESCPEKK